MLVLHAPLNVALFSLFSFGKNTFRGFRKNHNPSISKSSLYHSVPGSLFDLRHLALYTGFSGVLDVHSVSSQVQGITLVSVPLPTMSELTQVTFPIRV